MIAGYETIDADSPEAQAIREENSRQVRERVELFHRVFKQNPDGAKLLALLDQEIRDQRIGGGADVAALNYVSGRRDLILEFHDAVRAVEEGRQ